MFFFSTGRNHYPKQSFFLILSDFLTHFFHSFSHQVLCKRNEMQEYEVQKWIEAVLNEPFPEGKPYEDVLKDGVILCKLMNTLSPGSIPKINISGAHFKLMENVSRYLSRNIRPKLKIIHNFYKFQK